MPRSPTECRWPRSRTGRLSPLRRAGSGGRAKGTATERNWSGTIDARPPALRSPLAGGRAGRGRARGASGRARADGEALSRLFPLLASVLEPGMNQQTAIDFKQSVCARAQEAEEAIERALPDYPSGGGHKILLHALALV